MFVLIRPHWFHNNFDGMAIWPVIVVASPRLLKDKVFMNHERIHLRQQLELGLVFFYLWYGLEFLVRWIQLGKPMLAYRNISFEREAYSHEKNLFYLKGRSCWSFLRYL